MLVIYAVSLLGWVECVSCELCWCGSYHKYISARISPHHTTTQTVPLGAFQVGERTPTRATQTETSPPLHSASPSSTLHHTFTTDLTLVSWGCSKCSIYRSEAGCLEGVWHALYAKSKLVPLTPTSDISVGYLSISLWKLFKGMITHYSWSFKLRIHRIYIIQVYIYILLLLLHSREQSSVVPLPPPPLRSALLCDISFVL